VNDLQFSVNSEILKCKNNVKCAETWLNKNKHIQILKKENR